MGSDKLKRQTNYRKLLKLYTDIALYKSIFFFIFAKFI